MDALDVQGLLGRIRSLPGETLGLTGCGAAQVAERIGLKSEQYVEFEAWGRGANLLLDRQKRIPPTSYLLVSLGTGTSMLRVDTTGTIRLGGTALGGGTMLGLGGALAGASDHRELCDLAREGRRDQVDLLVKHIYPEGVDMLPPEASAASFGLLARQAHTKMELQPRAEDLAASVIGLVAENVGLHSCAVAEGAGLSCIVYGGTSLLDNPLLQVLLAGITAASGREAILLEDGSHAGAVGALELASL
jgi:type II pantothenate kinase